MKKSPYIFLVLSAILYALPFFSSTYLWWLIFTFPIPLLYATREYTVSFKEGYAWGILIFALHLHAGISIVADLAGNWWWIGFLIGIAMVLYQALMPAFLFGCTHLIIQYNGIASSLVRLALWSITLVIFIIWIDQYCMWIFGVQEGYPLMNPLIILAQHPTLLSFLPLLGKHVMLIFFLLVPTAIVIVIWHKNIWSFLFFMIAIAPWIYWESHPSNNEQDKNIYTHIKSLPLMIRTHHSSDAIRILARHLNNLIAKHPATNIVVMPESALNMFGPHDLSLLNEYLQKKIHLIFGACHCTNGCYYNALYWVHGDKIQARFNKKHAMIMTERLSYWMDTECIHAMYFRNNMCITVSDNERKVLHITHDNAFIPYICSELFFSEYPDDNDNTIPIIAIINDTLLIGSYLQELIYLIARLKAIQWQQEIIYVSYGKSVCIDKQGMVKVLE